MKEKLYRYVVIGEIRYKKDKRRTIKRKCKFDKTSNEAITIIGMKILG